MVSLPENPSIFVHIAAYRDREVLPTLAALFSQAEHPGRIYVGICWQYEPFQGEAPLEAPMRADQIRIANYMASQSQGVGWARYKAQKLYKGETFTLQIDSHTRFAQHWDSFLVSQWQQCGDPRAVLSCLPAAYDQATGALKTAAANVSQPTEFKDSGLLHLATVFLEEAPTQPVATAFACSKFVFAPAQLLKAMPSDPMVYFNEEDISLSLRIWSHGWNLYTPIYPPLYHSFNTTGKKRPLHWKDNPNWTTLQQRALNRYAALLSETETAKQAAFGLGQARSLQDFKARYGIDFVNQQLGLPTTAQSAATPAQSDPVDAAPQAETSVADAEPVSSASATQPMTQAITEAADQPAETSSNAAVPALADADAAPTDTDLFDSDSPFDLAMALGTDEELTPQESSETAEAATASASVNAAQTAAASDSETLDRFADGQAIASQPAQDAAVTDQSDSPAPSTSQFQMPQAGLSPGDFVPYFQLYDQEGRLREIQTFGGWQTLLVCLPTDSSQILPQLAALKLAWNGLRRHDLQVIAIAAQPPAVLKQLHDRHQLPFSLWSDPDHAVSRALGSYDMEQQALQSCCYTLTPNLRIQQTYGMDDPVVSLNQILDDIMPPPLPGAVVTMQAPVLMVPNVLTSRQCQLLLKYWQQGDQFEGKVGSGAQPSYQKSAKVRTDVLLQEPLMAELDYLLGGTLFPEIEKVFGFQVTHREDYKVGCYDAAKGGFFKPHRDNFDPHLAHRRVAMTLNLNSDYEGGGLNFPEYGSSVYRPDPGSAVIFPCSLMHQALPVTAGKRFMMVSFFFGEAEAQKRSQISLNGSAENPSISQYQLLAPSKVQLPGQATSSRTGFAV